MCGSPWFVSAHTLLLTLFQKYLICFDLSAWLSCVRVTGELWVVPAGISSVLSLCCTGAAFTSILITFSFAFCKLYGPWDLLNIPEGYSVSIETCFLKILQELSCPWSLPYKAYWTFSYLCHCHVNSFQHCGFFVLLYWL